MHVCECATLCTFLRLHNLRNDDDGLCFCLIPLEQWTAVTGGGLSLNTAVIKENHSSNLNLRSLYYS